MLYELAGLCSMICLTCIFSWFYNYCKQMVSFPISCNVIHLCIDYIFPGIPVWNTMNIAGCNILHHIDSFACRFQLNCSSFIWVFHLSPGFCFFLSLLKLFLDVFLSFRISSLGFILCKLRFLLLYGLIGSYVLGNVSCYSFLQIVTIS